MACFRSSTPSLLRDVQGEVARDDGMMQRGGVSSVLRDLNMFGILKFFGGFK